MARRVVNLMEVKKTAAVLVVVVVFRPLPHRVRPWFAHCTAPHVLWMRRLQPPASDCFRCVWEVCGRCA
jgi:hypothetical protein